MSLQDGWHMNTRHAVSEKLVEATERLVPVTLAKLDQAQLHDRVETKVILAESDVPAVPQRLLRHE
ncbi:MAG: hypothetical protein ACI81L_002262 [Verrucomicrobiales bacterium]|jgi:hypothetical protein